MRTYRWMPLTVVLVIFPATPAAGQDLTFLQSISDGATQAIEHLHGFPLSGPRYIDASSVQGALEKAGMPVPTVAELRALLERDEPRIIVVDSMGDAVERGPPDDARLQRFAEHAGWRPTADAPEELAWVAGDGVIIQISGLDSRGSPGEEKYGVVYHVYFTQRPLPPGFRAPRPVVHMPRVVRNSFGTIYSKRDGEWVRSKLDGFPPIS